MNTDYRRILLPLDGSDVAQFAIATAAGMSRLFGSELTLVTVLPEPVRTTQPVEVSTAPTAPGLAGRAANARANGTAYLMRVAKGRSEFGQREFVTSYEYRYYASTQNKALCPGRG